MKRINAALTTLLFFFLFNTAEAQDSIPEFGKIDIADMRMKECPFDKGASAMNLLNYENAHIYSTVSGLNIDVERRTRIKIFNQSGFKYASIDIPYSSKNQDKIKDISAITYNLDEQGNIIIQRLEKKDLFKESVNEKEKTVRFAFPAVKPGCVVEFKYVEKNEFNLKLSTWLFDDYIPTRKSIWQINYKTYMFSNIRLLANMPVEKYSDTSYDNIDAKYAMNNIPAFRHEAFMGSIKDNVQRLEFSILPSEIAAGDGSLPDKWSGISTYLFNSPYFGGQYKREIPGIKKELDSIKKLPVKEKISAVYQLVTKTVKWDGTYDFLSDNIEDSWTAKQGSSADLNFIMLSCLRRTGVECYPVITSTNDNGKIDITFGSLSQFNCVDVMATDGNTTYVLDATQKFQPQTVPPFNVFNNYGLVVDKKHGMLYNINDNKPLMRNAITVKASIDSSGKMTGTVFEYFYDYAKVDILSNTSEVGSGDDNSKELLGNDVLNLKVDSIKNENENDDGKPLIRSFNFKLEMQQTGDFYFLDPFFLFPFKKNPFVDSVRRSNIDFGSSQNYTVNMSISLPGNMTAGDLPVNKEIRLADTSFSFGRLIALQGDAIVIRNHLDVLNPVFPADEYPFLKQLFEKIYSLFNERIVLKRKS